MDGCVVVHCFVCDVRNVVLYGGVGDRDYAVDYGVDDRNIADCSESGSKIFDNLIRFRQMGWVVALGQGTCNGDYRV